MRDASGGGGRIRGCSIQNRHTCLVSSLLDRILVELITHSCGVLATIIPRVITFEPKRHLDLHLAVNRRELELIRLDGLGLLIEVVVVEEGEGLGVRFEVECPNNGAAH